MKHALVIWPLSERRYIVFFSICTLCGWLYSLWQMVNVALRALVR
jgi:hypothetical protein